MATVKSANVSAKLTLTLELDEVEVKALNGIFGYNVDAFLKVFYERMWKAYVQPYEAGVRSLHATIRLATSGPIEAYDADRQAMIMVVKANKQTDHER